MNNQTNEISSFLDFLVDAILIVDQQSNIVFANTSCCKLFGYKREVLLSYSLEHLIKSQAVSGHKEKVSHFIANQSHARAMMSRNIMPCLNAKGVEFNARISIANINFNGMQCGIATIQDYSTVQELIDDLKNEASTDPLTNLFNKRHLENVIENQYLAMHESGCLGVAYLDLNGFKAINDNLGHDTGDQLLVEISNRLTDQLRSSDICFRIGGDEFLVLFDINDHQNCQIEAKGIADKLQRLVTQPIEVAKFDDISIGVSIGVGLLPHDGKELGIVIDKADKAMYQSKAEKIPYAFVS
ncbi:sensor domain-containing diguanylate cyclase [Shewanella donghaensis]|uniref:sensor domain-containing diguanylate cyclase n=1 Tax=Shewanella donghaensis TaxID=238836 RepID=UPI0011844171|nr:sensor domain-containing diguanylate cyclase [Shewanella donghaensis]